MGRKMGKLGRAAIAAALMTGAAAAPAAAQSGAGGIAGGSVQAGIGYGACELSKNKEFTGALSNGVMPASAGFAGAAVNQVLDGGIKQIGSLVGRNASPFCNVDTPQAALLLTGDMIDEATIASAEAILAAQEGLNLQTSLKNDIQVMREARGDFGPLDKADAHKETTQRIGVGAVEVAAKLAELQAGGGLTPELRETVVAVSEKLSQATWFQIQSGLGVAAIKNNLGGLTQAQGERLLNSADVGLQSSYAQNLPGRMTNLVGNTAKILAIQTAVGQLADPDLQKQLKKADKRGKKAAKKIAKQRVEVANEPKTVDWNI
ncbi:MAG: hypothetical protein ACFB00_10350 [Parvularculaceae bacterium]